MKMGKLLAGTAAMATLAVSGAHAATDLGTATLATKPAGEVQVAQAETLPTNADLEARIDALESEVQDAEMRAAQAQNAPPPAPSGWWNNTSVSGRMYFDLTNISNKVNNARSTAATNATSGATNGNGTNFDIKRFYIGIDHTFNDIYSANVTTDTTYDGTTGAGQLYLKKAYLQAKFDPAFTVRLGSADLPWIPYDEGLYGYRYFENTLAEHAKFGTSADWGVHILGTVFDGILSYQFSAVNGGSYKKIPTGGNANRFNTMDFEGRVSASYDGFNLAVGGYDGKLGQPSGVTTFHTAQRFDVLGAYVANGLRAGVEYFSANNWTAVTSPTSDGAHGIEGFASYYFLPEWGVFGRYDAVKPNTKTAPLKNDNYYAFGISYSPVKIVDFSLAYKHDGVGHGSFTTTNGTIGSNTGLMKGSYDEVGIWGDFQW